MHPIATAFLSRVLLITVVGAAAESTEMPPPVPPTSGTWRAWLACPGGELPFTIVLDWTSQVPSAVLVNGSERAPIDRVVLDGVTVRLGIDPYDAEIVATVSDRGRRLDGTWRRRSPGRDDWATLPFHAVAGPTERFATIEPPAIDLSGRWAVRFASDPTPAVGLFATAADGTAEGTFLTATGDYRFLAGRVDGRRLRLSVFDGAHAFLFDARVGDDGQLRGDFWSKDAWHETWTAARDPDATTPDPMSLTSAIDGVELSDLVGRDLDGRMRSLADDGLTGTATLIELFGSWCPNCSDAGRYLAELHKRFGEHGLRVVGLAFEHTGDPNQDARQVRRYATKHGIEFPLLIAGLSDKARASAAFPLIDRVRAYPTLVFLDRQRRVAAIYTGFAGPAAPAEHRHMRQQIEARIDELLAPPDTRPASTRPASTRP